MTSFSLCPGQHVVIARVVSGWVGESVEASMSWRLSAFIGRCLGGRRESKRPDR